MPFIEVPGASLHHVSSGSGEPSVVLVHGSGCDHTDWAAQVGALAPTNRVVACDLRGHGRTRGGPQGRTVATFASDVRRVVEELGLAEPVLVGHSLGSRVVLQAAADLGDRVAGVVMVDGSRVVRDPATIDDFVALHVEDDPDFLEGIVRTFRSMFVPTSDPALAERLMSRAAATPEAVLRSQHASVMRWDTLDFPAAVASIRCPLLAIQSTGVDADLVRSALTADDPLPYVEEVARFAPQVRAVRVLGAGHFPMLERPDEVSEHLRAFVASVGSR